MALDAEESVEVDRNVPKGRIAGLALGVRPRFSGLAVALNDPEASALLEGPLGGFSDISD